ARHRGPDLAAAVRGRGPSPVRGGYHSFGLRPDLGHPVLPRPVAGRPRPQGAPGTIPRQDVTGQLLLGHLRPGPLPVLRSYDDVRRAASPRRAILEFCDSLFEAGSRLGRWDDGLMIAGPAS